MKILNFNSYPLFPTNGAFKVKENNLNRIVVSNAQLKTWPNYKFKSNG